MATWELLEQDTDLREERLAQELAEASNDSGIVGRHQRTHISRHLAANRNGPNRPKVLTSYKEKRMATALAYIARRAGCRSKVHTIDGGVDASGCAAWHSMGSIC